EQLFQRVEQAAMRKAHVAAFSLLMLGILAGAFIGFGAMANMFVLSDPLQSLAVTRILGGLIFSIGLIMVVVAGAELFTGNTLLVMAFVDRKITLVELLRNWTIVLIGNALGAFLLALLVYHSGHLDLLAGKVAGQYLAVADAKCALPFCKAFTSAILCNMLVCFAVWMSYACRTVTDKILAVVFPVTVFVSAGFEHVVANLFLFPLAVIAMDEPTSYIHLNASGIMSNLIPMLLGNMIGGGLFVGLVYYLVYGRSTKQEPSKKQKTDETE
ncbi:MAG: formate/nitrite transporter family protein, partial [Bacteroidota bacterium]